MISIPKNRIYNAYIIETYNYESAKKAIKEFAILNGFEKAYVDTDNHPDIFYLETEENIKIETIRRDIVESSIYAPKIANYKIYVIYDAVNMEVRAEDTILKTLEEPPDFDIFFLVTSNANKFLETIRSRCFIIKDQEENDYKKLLELDYMKDLYLKELETDIISIASSYEISELGRLVDNLNVLIGANNNLVNKKIAVFNFFEVWYGKMYRNKI